MKYLLLIAVLLVLWWAWKKRAERPEESAMPDERLPESVVACAHCGLHHPLSESLVDGDDNYCCPEHRLAGKSPKRP